MIRSRETEHRLSDTVVTSFGDLSDGDRGQKYTKNVPLDMGSSIE